MKQLTVLGTVLALAFPIPGWAQPPDEPASPALWAVSTGSAVVYLFGRMPVRNDTEWLTPEIEQALDASDVLWLENPRGDPARGDELIAEHGFQEGYSVLNVLDEPDRIRLIALLERVGMPPERLEGSKAWLSNLFLSNVIDRLNGIDGASSPDNVFRDRAETDGKEVRSEWQDIEELVEFSVALSDTIQIQMLRKALDDSETYEVRLDAWLRGDVEALAELSGNFAASYPDAHRRINGERNTSWAVRIQEMLTQDTTHFVSIGVGHLIGADNVLSELESLGLTIRRL